MTDTFTKLVVLLLCALTLSAQTLFSQQYKVLVREDFGSGTANPGPTGNISPGSTDYIADNFSSPASIWDGHYGLPKNPSGFDNFGTVTNAWQHGTDHTGNGYMMAINANPLKQGEAIGSYYLYSTNAFDLPGVQYQISFWGANMMAYDEGSTAPASTKRNPTFLFKEGYIGFSVRDQPNVSGNLYNGTVKNWILPRAGSGGTPLNQNYLPWSQFTENFTLPLSYNAAALYFNFFNSDTDPSTFGNDLAIDDIVISMRVVDLAGIVFDDANGNGIQDAGENIVNGTTTPVFAYITKANGTIISKVQVAADGTYKFTGDAGVPYTASNIGMKVIISSSDVSLGAPMNTSALAGGYVNVSEQGNNPAYINSGVTTKDGTMSITKSDINIANVNFGVNMAPASFPTTVTIPGTPVALNFGTAPLIPLQGSDPEQQPVQGAWGSAGKSIIITSLPNNGFTLTYNGQPVVAGQVIPGFNPALLVVSPGPASSTAKTTTFNFQTIDAAGAVSNVSPYTINFAAALPVVFGNITASINGGVLKVDFTTETEKNNDHFEIEGSADGTNFTKIGTVSSSAPDGTSDTPANYTFSLNVQNGLAVGGLVLLGFFAIGSAEPRRNRRRMTGALVTVIFIGAVMLVACSKKDAGAVSTKTKEVYIRVLQVDKDGGKSYSKVVKATKSE